MNKVAIYILTKDRLFFSIMAVQSALLNKCVDVIVSDCSENNRLFEYIDKLKKVENTNLVYIYRAQAIEQFEHISKIILENKYQYFTIFHDDDILYPNYAENMLSIHLSRKCLAVGCNYNLIDKNSNKISSNTFNMPSGFITSKTLLSTYCNISFKRHPCFSGYMYNKSLMKNVLPNRNDGGTWSDLAFLLKLYNLGQIYWHNEKLMDYRLHENNLSLNEKIIDRIKITGFIRHFFNLKKYDNHILQYKIKYLIKFKNKRNFNRIFFKLLFLIITKDPKIVFKLSYLYIRKYLL